MKFKFNNKYVRWGLTAFLVIATSICFYYLLFHGTNIKASMNENIKILMPIILGFVMAYLMTPILNYMEQRILIPFCKKCKIKESPKRDKFLRAIGIIVTVFLFFTIIYSLIAMMVSQIVPSIANIISNFDLYINNIINWLDKLSKDYPEIGNSIIKIIDDYSEDIDVWLNETVLAQTTAIIKTVSLSVISILQTLWNLLIGIIISVYVLASKEKFAGQAKKITYALFENDVANIVVNNFRFTHRTFIGFLTGKIVDSIIIGLLCYIGTTLLQTPYGILVSVVVGVTNVIPVFGPYLGAIPSIILIFVVDPLHPLNAVYFAIFILLLQQFDGNVLGPKILGESTGLTGFWVIFSITLFGGFFGILGMLAGVPIFAVIYAAVKSIVNTKLKKKNMPLETDVYINIAAVKDDKLYEYVPEHKLKKNEKDKVVFGKEFICNVNSEEMSTYNNINVTDEINSEEPTEDSDADINEDETDLTDKATEKNEE